MIAPAAIGTSGSLRCPEGFVLVEAEHPLPATGSQEAGRRALALARANRRDRGRLLVLLSGGASSLMALPAEGVSLADKRATTNTLLREGASIGDVNIVRKHLSAVKGGRLGAAAGRSLTWVLSDVVDDDLSTIGSGPTVADPSTYADALDVLAIRGGLTRYPPAVVAHLRRGQRGDIAETPKPGDPALGASQIEVVGDRFMAMRGAADEARRRGYLVAVVDPPVVGEARTAAATWIRDRVRHLTSLGRPCCMISSGETTVHVAGTGRGGRNQEFALALVPTLAALAESAAVASVGTDGVDGPTDAAGAVVDVRSERRAEALGVAPASAFLASNDSQAFFRALDDLIVTGPTGTNVGDLQVMVVA